MARPEKPITTSNRALGELQMWLRCQRDRSQQAYRALAEEAGCHATTLQRAASGEIVPKLETVLKYARVCDASLEQARRLWKRARYEETRLARGGRGSAPALNLIRDNVDLSAALQDLYERAGSPALRMLEKRAGAFGALPRSTAHRIVTKQTVPARVQILQAYLKACEAPEQDWAFWEIAWKRARHQETQDGIIARKMGDLKSEAHLSSLRRTHPTKPRMQRLSETTAAAEFTGLWRWSVVPGARAVANFCSCGRHDCPTPGAHPLAHVPEVPAGATLAEVADAWAHCRGAAVMLPVGRTFDVIEVAEPAGQRALIRLERMGIPIGPVTATPDGRAQFFVAPDSAAELHELLYRMGWDNPDDLDLQGLGPGSYITAPPSDRGGLGPVRWLRPPKLDSPAPPAARLLLGTLAYVAHRSRA